MARVGVLGITTVELVAFLAPTVPNVALPSIGADLGLDEAGPGWVTNAHLLTFGGFMPLAGRAADALGPRRVFAGGLTVCRPDTPLNPTVPSGDSEGSGPPGLTADK
ncbi:MFS transporter [Nocardia sp. NPDC004573]